MMLAGLKSHLMGQLKKNMILNFAEFLFLHQYSRRSELGLFCFLSFDFFFFFFCWLLAGSCSVVLELTYMSLRLPVLSYPEPFSSTAACFSKTALRVSPAENLCPQRRPRPLLRAVSSI